MMLDATKAVVVLSGGMDSTICLYWARMHFEEVHAVTFDYGQRHRIEIEAAKRIAAMAEISSHEVVQVPNVLRSTSPLLSDNPLEQYTDYESMTAEVGTQIEDTFVPMRNTFFLTIAANYAVAKRAQYVVTGICQMDSANYPDCTERFRVKLQDTFQQSLGCKLFISAPLMFESKARSIEIAQRLPGCMEALAYSHTSYDGKYPPTDNNHANVLRAHGFEEAGVPDPLVVRAWREGLMDLPATANYKDVK